MRTTALRLQLAPLSLPTKGMVLIDKPPGLSSHDVVAVVRQLTHEKRVGHAGTLDPLATGLLIILISRDWTKQQDTFLHMDKTYVCQAQLGYTTDSYDTTGMETSRAELSKVMSLTDVELHHAANSLTGQQSQVVPAYSAVKFHGQKLYELSRANAELPPLPSRTVTISQFELIAISRTNQGITVECKIACSSGTYVRSLLHDWGQQLGVGATVSALRRTSIGEYRLNDALNYSPEWWPGVE